MPMQRESSDKQFFLTPPHPCSYFEDRDARTLFLDPRETIGLETYTTLTRVGFRRSGSHLYRPYCEGCSACTPTRVPVDRFRWSRRFRRVVQRNSDIEVTLREPACTGSYYDLYARYIQARHPDGGMYPPSEAHFRSFLMSEWSETSFLCLSLRGKLLGVAVTDHIADGLSAIYTFFDPDCGARSLGVYAVLAQIQHCRANGMPYLYLGYWLRDCAKMSYKIDYRPIELLISNRWTLLE
jgi:arginyl-tRNA--protein-N-Asp/Glu arginylyltransferase